MSDYVRIPKDAIEDIRWALTHGLHAANEVSRSQTHFDTFKRCGHELPEGLKDAMPSCSLASDGDMTRYAEALIWLNHAQADQD